ncbi:NADH-quinone oxidoreductase subunit NuoH [Iamia sp.]|jgi:NADH-quinone oxidoreductase subunit H|uniref:NADH-quinone oxidoreductase subunit NuoH n=1 Tax=Iamia sp. TaxID=2722710 RepID=UPI002C07E473|nr:NADH-quinone oxidoreductase subunit NuoH [Iamia sp.]HXH57639.1 NADH-quinone oxidoreductase subunit NuoH [Iamia sp.]
MNAVLALDPLLAGDIDLGVVAIVALKTVVAFTLLLTSVLFMVWFERKAIGDLQNRIGPNRAGPFGLFQTVADGLKFFMKEDSLPDRADRRIFILAPYLTAIPAFLVFAVIPIGGDFSDGRNGVIRVFGRDTLMQLADPPVGVLFILAMSSVAVYGIMLAGWSSGSKYPLLGSVRASAQMVSYEAALGLTVVTVVMVAGSLSTNAIVSAQSTWQWNLWITGFVPFVIFVIAATAELNRPPFDLVEAEQELVGGFNTEYSAFRFALFFLAEFMNTVTMSAIIVTLFLGGPAGPVLFGPGWLWGTIWFSVKLFAFLFMFVWFRATLPRVRYDQLMDLGWKVMIPLALAWLVLIAGRQVGDDAGWSPVVVPLVGAAGLLLGYGLLTLALRAAERVRSTEEEVGV